MYRKKFPEHNVDIDEADKYVHTINISYDPMDEEGFSDYEKEKMDEIYHLSHENPQEALPLLFDLTDSFPQNKVLANYLQVCLSRCSRKDEAHELIEKSYKDFPDYLIGRLNYATLLLERGQYDEAKEIMHGPSMLSDFISGRKTHFTEAMSFYFFWCLYYLRTGDITKAEFNYRVVWCIDPENDRTATLRHMLSKAKTEAIGIQ
jgi:tetratricopeptide (TPR) repeat protein